MANGENPPINDSLIMKLQFFNTAKKAAEEILNAPKDFELTPSQLVLVDDVAGALAELLGTFPPVFLEQHNANLENCPWLKSDGIFRTRELIVFWKLASNRGIDQDEVSSTYNPKNKQLAYSTPLGVKAVTRFATDNALQTLTTNLSTNKTQFLQPESVLDLNNPLQRETFENIKGAALCIPFDPTNRTDIRAFQIAATFQRYTKTNIATLRVMRTTFNKENDDNFKKYLITQFRLSSRSIAYVVKPELYEIYLETAAQRYVDYFTNFPM